MKTIKVLEVNNIDLPGRRFNGYDMIDELSDNNIKIKQAVVIKQSTNDNVVRILPDARLKLIYEKFMNYETKLSIMNVFSITSPALMNLDEYKEADIIHFHMFHNTKLSLYSIIKISKEKKVVISLHDPWFLTGRCVHFYECDKWKTGCDKCGNLGSLFPLKQDNCNKLWNLKKYIFDNSNVDLIVTSNWMYNLAKESPIFANQIDRIHLIPFGIDLEKFKSVSVSAAKDHYGIKKDEITLFLRSQMEFKGTKYVLEALKLLNVNKKINVITCDTKHLLDDVKNKYRIIDLGVIGNQEMIYAMNACDMFLMPSKGEAFGMMAIEAMACSKCVIVFDNTSLPSVTFAPECGVLVKNRDSMDLMLGIKRMIENDKERNERGNMGYRLCKEHYSLDVYNKSMKSLYKSVYTQNITPTTNSPQNANKSKELNKLFNTIWNNKKIHHCKIDFSDPSNLDLIDKFNEEVYFNSFRKFPKITIKIRLKNIIKSNDFLFKIIKKILRR